MVDLIYSRNSANQALTIGEIHERAPAVFADKPVDSVTDKYRHISTFDVMQTLKFEGWLPVQAAQSAPTKRTAYNDRAHQRHLVAFARESDLERPEGRPEIVLYNSSDKSSALKLYDGFFRWICSNSLVAGSGDFTRLKHLKSRMYNFDDILQGAITRASGMGDRVDNMKDHSVDYDEARHLIGAGLSARWESYRDMMTRIDPYDPMTKGTFWTEYTIDQILQNCPRKSEQAFISNQPVNLWQVFNRTQEFVMRGGIDLLSVTDRNKSGAFRRARGIADPRKAITINSDLWETFEGYAA